jgi:hypothetical protein
MGLYLIIKEIYHHIHKQKTSVRRLFEPEAVNAYQELFSRQEFSNPLRLQMCKINYSAYGLQLPFSKILYA